MEAFNIQRSLVNSKFEGYKLELLRQEDAVVCYDLPFKPTQIAQSGRVPLTFQEVQSRVTHNHLALSSEASRAVYVDSADRVVLVTLADPPTFHAIYELPKSLRASNHRRHSEYPSVLFFRSDVILAADGHGILYVLKLNDHGVSDLLGMLSSPTGTLDSPFRLHSVHHASPDAAIVILSSRSYDLDPPKPAKSGNVQFDIFAISIDLSALQPDRASPFELLWQRRGKEVPIYTGFVPVLNAFLLIGGSIYRELDAPAPPTYEPSSDEYAPIPRADENLDTGERDSPRPYPYSWTQTSDSVTVAFPLPSSTPKSNIRVVFSPKTLTLHVNSESSLDPRVPIPRYSAKPLWDGILPSTSFWTWDRESEHSFGLLSLHLDKANEGTKWIHIFAAAATSTSADSSPEDLEVPETLDPSELWQIRETLEKYTGPLLTGQDVSGVGLGMGVPSLGQGEMDEEVDQSVGREAYQTWVGSDGHAPSWWKNARETSFCLLSTPLPGESGPGPTFIIKNYIDGALFSLVDLSIPPPKWDHVHTFSALAFVLASKRDARFTYHTDKAVYAFESGTEDRGGNVYIYRAAPMMSKSGKQVILKVGDGHGGSLLGVSTWDSAHGQTLVCLTDRQLVVVKPS